MTARPWVTPQEVRDYTENPAVKQRSDARLSVDITRAEQYVITLTHNDFSEYNEIPSPVKTAILILADTYATNAIRAARDMKSETYDDYSYQSDSTAISVDSLDLAALLDGYVNNIPKGGVNMRLRKL